MQGNFRESRWCLGVHESYPSGIDERCFFCRVLGRWGCHQLDICQTWYLNCRMILTNAMAVTCYSDSVLIII